MNEIDHLALDGHALRLFLTVLEEGSVTSAADRLNLTQSAVSHGLQRLRRIVGDPLFVKSGRGIVATAHAHRLAAEARALIDRLEDFARPAAFDAARARLSFVLAANDYQADLLLPRVFRLLARDAARAELRIVPSGSPTPELLRERRCDLILSPFPPAASDIVQRKLFEDSYVCFYDSARRAAPADMAAYLAARHVTVVHSGADRLEFDKAMEQAGASRDIVASVAGFAGVPGFLRGTDLLATLPALLARGAMAGFAHAPLPLDGPVTPAMRAMPMFMAWHRRDQHDPAHGWLRAAVIETAQALLRG